MLFDYGLSENLQCQSPIIIFQLVRIIPALLWYIHQPPAFSRTGSEHSRWATNIQEVFILLGFGWEKMFSCSIILTWDQQYEWDSAAAAAAESHQSCPTLCDPTDSSPPGSAVPGILQARTLGWVAISFSNAWKGKVKVKSLSRVRPSVTPWTAAYQAPPSMGFSRVLEWGAIVTTI